MTEDLERRLAEHSRKFDKMTNVKVDLVFYHFVDPKYVSKAEGKLKNYFDAFEKDIAYESEKELVILREREMKNVKEQFENIGIIYAGVSDVLQKKIDKMECDHKMDKIKMEHEIKMVKRENEHLVNQHEMEVRNYKLELKNRDLEMRLMSMERIGMERL